MAQLYGYLGIGVFHLQRVRHLFFRSSGRFNRDTDVTGYQIPFDGVREAINYKVMVFRYCTGTQIRQFGVIVLNQVVWSKVDDTDVSEAVHDVFRSLAVAVHSATPYTFGHVAF